MKKTMMVMMAAVLATTVAGSVKTAHASTMFPILECKAVNSGPDYGLTVSILEISGPMTVQGPMIRYSATISEQTIAGERELGTFTVRQKAPKPHVYGAAQVYYGQDIRITVQSDVAPRPQGYPGTITAEVANRRIVEELNCTFKPHFI
ncbi:MAG: hypothetical protein ACXWP5_03755 [Bdellovibrionota bacterium]